jgi:uncharacterized protein YbjT (DUF2867 family)
MESHKINVLMLGATGLIGSECIEKLLAHEQVNHVYSLVRKHSGIRDPKLEEHITDFEKLEESTVWDKADAVICCLGTTMANAKTREAFLKVDYEYPLAAAGAARAANVKHFILVSALGAHPRSTFFYNRVKGSLEEAITMLDFNSFSVFQPSLLLGDRAEVRPGEKTAQQVMTRLAFLMMGPLKRYKPIHARAVAHAMVNMALDSKPGKNVYPSQAIAEIALK